MSLLSVKNLRVTFGSTVAVSGVDLDVHDGELLGIVGESGSGKSVSMLAVMGLIDTPGRVSADEMRFDGIDLLHLTGAERRRIIGQRIAMVFQDPQNSLNPSYTVGAQIGETLKLHLGLRGAALEQRVLQLLDQVEIPDARRRMLAYPHQLSGGMNQRVMIAMAIACGPRLLIADEPTTALDVTIQAQVLALLSRLQRERGMSLVLITHDLAVVAEMAKRVCVMYAGKVVEEASVDTLFDAPRHAYTAALLAARPRDLASSVARPGDAAPALQAELLARHYRVRRGLFREPATVKALNGVSFTLRAGCTLAVVGESGCGKSTLARQLTLIEPPTAGELRIGGVDAAAADKTTRAQLQQRVQMVFQNPYASLNPRKTVAATLAEPLVIHTALKPNEQRERILAMLEQVGLRPEHAQRYPHMFSGGQRQRIAIARAMMLKPAVVVADEPVSALDVSIQAQILNLFMDLQDSTATAYIFISHNLEVVAHVAHEVMVMYFGAVVEIGPKAQVLGAPLHPYTQALRSAAPAIRAVDRRQRVLLRGEMPSPLNPPSGCAFHTRCPLVQTRCRVENPALRELAGRQVACHVVTA